MDPGEALFRLQRRIPTGDTAFFCTAITIQRSAGGNLAEILDSLGEVIRERFKVLSHARVLSRVAQDLESLANDLAQGIQDLGQVAAGAPLDRNGGAEESRIPRGNAALEPEEGLPRVHSQPGLFR